MASAQTDRQPITETMELTDEAPPEVSPSSSPPCGSPEVHGIAEPGQGPEEARKAYASRSSVALGCPTLFRAASPGAFNLTGDATVHLFVGCDQTTVMHQPLANLRVWLTRNGEALNEAQASLDTVCSSGSPMEAEVTIEAPEDARFNESDTMGLNVTPFGSPNAAVDNLHFLVGGEQMASTLTLPGISEVFQPEEPEQELVDDNETDEPSPSDLQQQATATQEDGIPAPGVAWMVVMLAALAGLRRRAWL